jgi:pyrroline-5-carboxylate reductase
MRRARPVRSSAETVAFLGGGRITAALVAGLRHSGYRGPIVVCDRHAKKVRSLQKLYRVIAGADAQTAAHAANIVFVAVRPASVAELLAQIKFPPPRERKAPPPAFVSLAAGMTLAQLHRQLGAPVRWARAMPSPVCRVGAGLTALAFARNFSPEERHAVRGLFARMGKVIEIPERIFDAFTVTYSSSHGYHALAVLANAAMKIGLDRKTALAAAAHALADGINASRDNREALSSLIEEAATPGGIAAAVMSALDRAGYPRLVEQALRAGVARARRSHSNPPRR